MGWHCGRSADHLGNSKRDSRARKGEWKVNNDHIRPAERTGRGPRRGNACLGLALRRMRAKSDLVVATLSLAVIAILVWLALDDLVAWALGLPPVTL